MTHRPGRGLVEDASGQGPPAGKEITSQASDDVHARQDLRPRDTEQEHFFMSWSAIAPSCGRELQAALADATGVPGRLPMRRGRADDA